MSGVLRVLMLSIAEVIGKPPTESVFFEKFARIAVVVDEVINEVRRQARRMGKRCEAHLRHAPPQLSCMWP